MLPGERVRPRDGRARGLACASSVGRQHGQIAPLASPAPVQEGAGCDSTAFACERAVLSDIHFYCDCSSSEAGMRGYFTFYQDIYMTMQIIKLYTCRIPAQLWQIMKTDSANNKFFFHEEGCDRLFSQAQQQTLPIITQRAKSSLPTPPLKLGLKI